MLADLRQQFLSSPQKLLRRRDFSDDEFEGGESHADGERPGRILRYPLAPALQFLERLQTFLQVGYRVRDLSDVAIDIGALDEQINPRADLAKLFREGDRLAQRRKRGVWRVFGGHTQAHDIEHAQPLAFRHTGADDRRHAVEDVAFYSTILGELPGDTVQRPRHR